MARASRAMRLFLFNASVLISIGIWLSGYDRVHWFSYLVPAFFLVAAAVGICPGLAMARKLVGEK
ncbi:MAG: hypothetical protein ABFS23_06135 [Pseudomonadota bacterium]